MGDREKLLRTIQAGASHVRIDDLVLLMEAYGFTWRRTGHGYLFFHDRLKTETMPHGPLPHGREKTVLHRYVEQCIRAVERAGMEE